MIRGPIEWWNPQMGRREKELIASVIDSHFPNDGKITTEFERQIAGLCGAPYAVATTSGTAAIFLALVACGVKPGDEVIVPDVTFIATANAVALAGAVPVFADADRRTFCVDPSSIESLITPRTRAIVPVHVSGRSCAMGAILELAKKHHLKVVEDAAEALGSGTRLGALGTLGNAGCFSFTANKLITTGQGGMVVTHDPAIHQRLRELKDQGRPKRGTGGDDIHVSLGYNFKFTDLQAAMGLAQTESFKTRLEHQRLLFGLYKKFLGENDFLRLPGFDLDAGECPLWIDAFSEGRDGLCDSLLKQRIQTRKFWHPLHTQAPYLKAAGAECPRSVEICRGAFWLPSSFTLTEGDVREVARAVQSWARTADMKVH